MQNMAEATANGIYNTALTVTHLCSILSILDNGFCRCQRERYSLYSKPKYQLDRLQRIQNSSLALLSLLSNSHMSHPFSNLSTGSKFDNASNIKYVQSFSKHFKLSYRFTFEAFSTSNFLALPAHRLASPSRSRPPAPSESKPATSLFVMLLRSYGITSMHHFVYCFVYHL